jgi:DNA-binding XRE family transcriptional regulator
MSKQEQKEQGTSAAAEGYSKTESEPMNTKLARRAHASPNIIAIEIHGSRWWIEDTIATQLARDLIGALAETPYSKEPTLAERREQADLTQQQAADALGISRTYLSQIERGKARTLTLRNARKLSELYDCTIEQLGILV